VTITGADAATGTITASTTSQVTVTGIPGIALANSAPITFTAGATSGNTSTLTVAPSNGFTGAVGISCAVTSAPAGAVDPITCSAAPHRSPSAERRPAQLCSRSIRLRAPRPLWINRSKSCAELAGQPWHCASSCFCLLAGVAASRGSQRWWSCSRSARSSVAVAALVDHRANHATGTTAGAYVVTVTASPAGASPLTATVNVTVN
jgi:hypothetical protein